MNTNQKNVIFNFLLGTLIFINIYYLGKVLITLIEIFSFKYELFWNNIMILRICIYILLLLGVVYLIFKFRFEILINNKKHILILSIIPVLLYASRLIFKNIFGSKYILAKSIEYLSRIESSNIIIDTAFKIIIFCILIVCTCILYPNTNE